MNELQKKNACFNKIYDLAITWNWEYDKDFVNLLEKECIHKSVSLLHITQNNFEYIKQSLLNNIINFRFFLDRASDSDNQFLFFNQWSTENNVYEINPHKKAIYTYNKINMHYKLFEKGIHTPYTVILPPYEIEPYLSAVDLRPLGEKFFIKPASGGGGDGIIKEATTLQQILIARQEKPADYYMLQPYIKTVHIGEQVAWFRVIYCTGKIYPNWWNQETHIYIPVSYEEECLYHLESLHAICQVIANICGLNLFSTEIALTPNNKFIVVDYVNDQLDLRLQSKSKDSVPDNVVRDISSRIVEHILSSSSD